MNSSKVNTLKLSDPRYPAALNQVSPAPKQIYISGAAITGWVDRPKIAIVGSRKATPYGRLVTRKISSELAAAGCVIISGLAYGIDAVAHEAALDAGGLTVAVLPTPLSQIYPAGHRGLANRILGSGGSLISEYGDDTVIYRRNFTDRNRILSGFADCVIITEAAASSGSLNTARYALEQGKTVMAVPGNINSPTSFGCNNLIKSGALPLTETSDVFFAMGLKPAALKANHFRGTVEEELILKLIRGGVASQEELAVSSGLGGLLTIQTITMLEIRGVIKPQGAGNWTVV